MEPDPVADQCLAITKKGTRCTKRPKDEARFCGVHLKAFANESDDAAMPAKRTIANLDARNESGAVATLIDETDLGLGDGLDADFKATADPNGQKPAATDDDAGDAGEADDNDDADDGVDDADVDYDADHDDMAFGSSYSGMLGADPFADEMTREMAIGEEDVEIVDERHIGRDARPPRLDREAAEAKALEIVGPAPDIAPEEDLEGRLADHERRFNREVQRLMGRGGPRRGRRGGARKGRRGGRPNKDGRGPRPEGGGPPRRRGRRGGRKRRGGSGPSAGRSSDDGSDQASGGGGGGDAGGSEGGSGSRGPRRSGPPRGNRRRGPPRRGRSSSPRRPGGSGGAPKNAARDGPLANRRASKGPKGQRQGRRRQPDV